MTAFSKTCTQHATIHTAHYNTTCFKNRQTHSNSGKKHYKNRISFSDARTCIPTFLQKAVKGLEHFGDGT